MFCRLKNKKAEGKKNKKKAEQEELADFIEKDPNDQEDDGDFDPSKPNKTDAGAGEREEENDASSSDESDEIENGPLFQERKFNFMSEFAMITDYAIIAKFLGLIRGNRLLKNRKEINMSVFKFMKRIVDLMKAEWLFFQIDFLNIFHEIISNNEIRVIINRNKSSCLSYL